MKNIQIGWIETEADFLALTKSNSVWRYNHHTDVVSNLNNELVFESKWLF